MTIRPIPAALLVAGAAWLSVAGLAQSPQAGEAAAFLRCMDQAGVTLVSAHRGGPAPGYPENAIETFERTARMGPVLLEVDVRQSADGTLLLMHDQTLDRTTTGSGPVGDSAWAEIAKLRLRDNDGRATLFRVPTLTAALDWATAWDRSRIILQLDVKRGVDAARVAEAVAAAEAESVTSLIAYNLADALAALEANPAATVSITVDRAGDIDSFRREGLAIDQIFAWTGVGNPDPSLWQALDDVGVPAAFGTMWDLDNAIAESGRNGRYRRFAGQGVDILATDRPAAAFKALGERQDTAEAAAACTRPR